MLIAYVILAAEVLAAFVYFSIGFVIAYRCFDEDDFLNRVGLGLVFGLFWFPIKHSNGGWIGDVFE